MQTANLEPVQSGFNEKVRIYPTMISVETEDAFTQRLTDISDSNENKNALRYEILKDFLIEVSAQMPERLVKEDNSIAVLPLVEKAETTEDAIKTYFKELNTLNEKVVTDLFWKCKTRLKPTEDF